MSLTKRDWLPEGCESYIQKIAADAAAESAAIESRINALAAENAAIHEAQCFNLNPAANVMNPKAEAMLSRGLGSRPSLGYPGDKYEMGLEAVEKIEATCDALCAEIFNAKYVESRVMSGAMANLYAFMATCEPGDAVIVPSAAVAGHVTHHSAGAAGLYRLNIRYAPVDAENYSVDVDALRAMARDVQPKLITLGGSLNLFPHPIAQVREIADEVGAVLMFDAAHQCGLFAGGAWPNPLDEGAHLMTFSTYKSLGGPAGGLIVSNDAALMQKIDAIAFPGLTANFDVGRVAALALTMLDWREHGSSYTAEMIATARALADALAQNGVPVFSTSRGMTDSHQFAFATDRGGQAMAKHLRQAGILASGIGLPLPDVTDDMNGLRLGTPEAVRWGVTHADAPDLAALIADAIAADDPASLAPRTAEMRSRFSQLRFIRGHA